LSAEKINTNSDIGKSPLPEEEEVFAYYQTECDNGYWSFNVRSLSELKERMKAVAQEYSRSHIDGGYFVWVNVQIPFEWL
jgi:hypothetical protein